MAILTGNYNAYKLRLDARGTTAWHARVKAVQELAPDLLGLQEVLVDEGCHPARAVGRRRRPNDHAFAEDCGLSAPVPATPGRPQGVAVRTATRHRSDSMTAATQTAGNWVISRSNSKPA